MSLYLLPCDCGAKVPISRSQAGMTLPCSTCGKNLEVPTIRKMTTLEMVAAPSPLRKNKYAGILRFFSVVTLLVGVIGLSVGGSLFFKWYTQKTRLEAGGMNFSKAESDYLADMRQTALGYSPADTWDYWNSVTSSGMVDSSPPAFFLFKRDLEARFASMQKWFGTGIAAMVLFGVLSWGNRRRSETAKELN